ncbi:hypothetical protein CBR_g3779 [Chara braunii]|uniref:DNA polymerase III beta sliding clamp N-terminal domain-containing protein n=1 Tax=Chara braunii TaxID=69332 RepID=A0A388KGB5_CHABU|nr:hypothetical protein CBR_g3779 [Chara braunii]|eukprot:GBG69081.1 hypothetical protein CBR_g3779 [Chara braunii]
MAFTSSVARPQIGLGSVDGAAQESSRGTPFIMMGRTTRYCCAPWERTSTAVPSHCVPMNEKVLLCSHSPRAALDLRCCVNPLARRTLALGKNSALQVETKSSGFTGRNEILRIPTVHWRAVRRKGHDKQSRKGASCQSSSTVSPSVNRSDAEQEDSGKAGLLFACNVSSLKEGVSRVMTAVAKRRAVAPILSHILIEAVQESEGGGYVSMTATDGAVAVKCSVPGAVVRQAGLSAVPAKSFFTLIRELSPTAEVEISAAQYGGIVLNAGNGKFMLQGEKASDFPVVVELSGAAKVEGLSSGEFTLPIRAVDEICRGLGRDGRTPKAEEQMGMAVLELLRDKVVATVERGLLISLLRQMALFCEAGPGSGMGAGAVHFHLRPGVLVLRAGNSDIGEGKASMDVNYEGVPVDMAFNPALYIDALLHCNGDVVAMGFSKAGGGLSTLRDESATFLIMAMMSDVFIELYPLDGAVQLRLILQNLSLYITVGWILELDMELTWNWTQKWSWNWTWNGPRLNLEWVRNGIWSELGMGMEVDLEVDLEVHLELEWDLEWTCK